MVKMKTVFGAALCCIMMSSCGTKEWEYKIVRFDATKPLTEEDQERIERIQRDLREGRSATIYIDPEQPRYTPADTLNELGKQGWELVSVYDDLHDPAVNFVLKRTNRKKVK